MGISAAVGSLAFKPGVCTSTTRPAAPFEGQLIYETDTNQAAVWDGSYWLYMGPGENRNILYNGAMQVAQRGTSTASISSASQVYYTADRWATAVSTLGTWTQSVENDAPTGSGFRKSLKMLCTTADASPVTTDVLTISQFLEGQDCQAIRKGTSSAQQMTISFWVKSNVTGTYNVELNDNDNGRFYSKAYTISASATWEFKTVTVPADTTGALDNDAERSFSIRFWLASGPSYTTGSPVSGWVSTSANLTSLAPSQTNLAAATNNYWQVTGVQLNVGAVAAPFEFKSFGRELRECQRYYEKTYDVTTVPGTNVVAGCRGVGGPDSVASTYLWSIWSYKVEKRGSPTVTIYDISGNSGKITTWQSGGQTANVTPSNGNWQNGNSAHMVLHQGNVAGWYYQAVSSAEL